MKEKNKVKDYALAIYLDQLLVMNERIQQLNKSYNIICLNSIIFIIIKKVIIWSSLIMDSFLLE